MLFRTSKTNCRLVTDKLMAALLLPVAFPSYPRAHVPPVLLYNVESKAHGHNFIRHFLALSCYLIGNPKDTHARKIDPF